MILLFAFLIVIIILAIIALLMTERGSSIKNSLHFFITGLDSGFKLSEILFLGKIASSTGLENPTTLFWSVSSLDRCTAEIVRRTKLTGTENIAETQRLLSGLYAYRTKLELDQARKKRGVQSSRDIAVGQRVRILLRGVGVFSSKVMRNTQKSLVLDFPSGTKIAGTLIDWTNKPVSVYFWRHDDAGYVFDTVVIPDPVSNGKAIIHVAHADNLVRSQKRKSVRARCSIYAQMYLIRPGEALERALEPEPGMKCLLEDLSEDGAMVLIGGKAAKGMQIKLQFLVHEVLIVMAGVIRAVEYNQDTNQSRIHFESGELNPRMKNAILTFVYNVLPEEEKEELDAIRLSEEDGITEAESADSSAPDVESRHDLGNVSDFPDMPDFVEK